MKNLSLPVCNKSSQKLAFSKHKGSTIIDGDLVHYPRYCSRGTVISTVIMNSLTVEYRGLFNQTSGHGSEKNSTLASLIMALECEVGMISKHYIFFLCKGGSSRDKITMIKST